MLPRVRVDTYGVPLRDGDEQYGDRANKAAFNAILDDWRKRTAKAGGDPLADIPEGGLNKRNLAKLLDSSDIEAAGLVLGSIEAFAREFASVITRFLRLKDWKGTERIAIGGGFRGSRVGELVIGRAAIQLKLDGASVEICPIREHVDEAAMIGVLQLVPNWMLAGHDAILAADIGGTNARVGVVTFNFGRKKGSLHGKVVLAMKWRHEEDETPSRTRAVERLAGAFKSLTRRAQKRGLKLAPFIGIGCPGIINSDGSIKTGGQNLPGNWESDHFNLAQELTKALPRINGEQPLILIHNDAVLQGLSQVPYMGKTKHWGILTIGTGLGNGRFTNLADDRRRSRR
ncbi:MAG TPA: hypothetical protein VG328_09690 [Stellaceae bacterium]|nr:hypothetical protein [Stellaceae bacterium]